jgi:hypothetical protein
MWYCFKFLPLLMLHFRILVYQTTEVDEQKAVDCVMHYSYWTSKQFRTNLSLPNRGYYYFWFQADRTLAFLGIGGSVFYGTLRMAKCSSEWIKKYRQMKQSTK